MSVRIDRAHFFFIRCTMYSRILFCFCSLAESWAVFGDLAQDAVRRTLSLVQCSVVLLHLSVSFGHTDLTSAVQTFSYPPDEEVQRSSDLGQVI